MANKVLCDSCTAVCCSYFAFPIETPKDKGDYDDIRWYLCHKGITVYVDDDKAQKQKEKTKDK